MLQPDAPPIVLASASAARAALLRAAGLRFEAVPAPVDEESIRASARAEGYPPGEAATMLAEAKARRVATRRPEALVIGCDQILTCRVGAGESDPGSSDAGAGGAGDAERWFDKPRDGGEARAHLAALRGREHRLHTAVLCWRDGARIWVHVAVPRLRMRPFSDAFLDGYLAAEGEAVLASVGAYRLEGPGAQLFDRVDGEHAAVLGLPLLPLLGFLRQHGALGR